MKIIALAIICIFFSNTIFAQDILIDTLKTESMKSPMLGLRTVVYKVADLNKAKEWYTQAFEVEPYFDEPFYVGFNIGGYELGLLPEENPTTEKAESVFAYWGVENIMETYDRLINLGGIVHEEPNNVGDELMVASIKDPWGNIIGIIYNPYFNLD